MPRVGELAQTSVEIFVNFHVGKIVIINRTMHEGKPVRTAVQALIGREVRSEIE
jgi:hypothetical protein